MEVIDHTLNNKGFDLEKTSAKMTISEIFTDKTGCYLNEFTLFTAHFNTIPNVIDEENIDCEKASDWLSKEYKLEIKEHYYNKRYFNRSKKPQIDYDFYFIYEDLIIYFDTNLCSVRFLFRNTPLSKVIDLINKYRKKKTLQKPEVSLLVEGMRGLELKTLKITKPKLKIDDNYNEDFKEIHQTILKRLSSKNDKGLVLLHGKPGTGKTSYIRYLISSIRKDVIFLPPNMASAITNPNLISVLIDNPNSIFVIEDAENIVIDRNIEENSPVSALLNISDGLLADCLNVQIICSFNTDLSKVDSALMRKGRLIAKYEFKELEIDKAQELSDKLGYKTIIDTPMTLTSIYNQDEMNFKQLRKSNPIGFQVMSNVAS